MENLMFIYKNAETNKFAVRRIFRNDFYVK